MFFQPFQSTPSMFQRHRPPHSFCPWHQQRRSSRSNSAPTSTSSRSELPSNSPEMQYDGPRPSWRGALCSDHSLEDVFGGAQDSLIDCQAPIPAPTPVAPAVSLASMDSAVVMVHTGHPGHPHAHLAAYSFLPGNLIALVSLIEIDRYRL